MRYFFGRTWMRLRGATVPRSCMINGFPRFPTRLGRVRLGERVNLQCRRYCYPMGASLPTNMFSTKPGATIDVGDDTYIAFSAFHAFKGISIGRRVMIASGCRITDNDGHEVDRLPRFGSVSDAAEPVTIEDDVWLAVDVMVCKGVTIGKGSVIGAKSLVLDDIPPGVLAAGIPARVIRPLRLDERERAAT